MTTEAQWIQAGAGKFFPRNPGVEMNHLPAGRYTAQNTDNGLMIVAEDDSGDIVTEYAGTIGAELIDYVKGWAENRHLYASMNMMPKLGILTHGPQGSGKTTLVRQLADFVINKMDGIYLDIGDINDCVEAVQFIREREADRLILVAFEDIDEIIRHQSEHSLLQYLDGPDSVPNVITIASTNYVDRLPARLVKRPGRFDHVVEIPYPEAGVRNLYFTSTLPLLVQQSLGKEGIEELVKATEGFGMAHLREVCVGIVVMRQDVNQVLTRVAGLVGEDTQPPSAIERAVSKHLDSMLKSVGSLNFQGATAQMGANPVATVAAEALS